MKTDTEHFLRTRFWNIGSGPAIVRSVRLATDDVEMLAALPEHGPVAANQVRDDELPLLAWPDAACDALFTVEYTHANGARYVATGLSARLTRRATS